MESIEDYFKNLDNWKSELILLRKILLSTPLTETLKWKTPCYTYKNKNVVLLGKFKTKCTISFFKGALLSDPEKVLENPGPNSKQAKILNFTNCEQIIGQRKTIENYILEAIGIENNGAKLQKSENELPVSEELRFCFEEDPQFKLKFFELTKGKQRGYILHFNNAKQSQTRLNRINKSKEKIILGYGFHDCTCGLSTRMPNCDGSHRLIQRK